MIKKKDKQPLAFEEAYERAAALCARGEKAPSEIREKLRLWQAERPDDILDRLIDEGFLDLERYAKAFAADKWRLNKWGKEKIAQALYQKQVGSEAIRAALAAIDADDYKIMAREQLARKWAQLDPTDPQRAQKLVRFAASRGYPTALAWELARQTD